MTGTYTNPKRHLSSYIFILCFTYQCPIPLNTFYFASLHFPESGQRTSESKLNYNQCVEFSVPQKKFNEIVMSYYFLESAKLDIGIH